MSKFYADENGVYIIRASRKNADGSIEYARDHGVRGFKIYINRTKKAK